MLSREYTQYNGIYAGNQDFTIPNLFMGLNGDVYFFFFMSLVVLNYRPTESLEEMSQ